MQVKRCALGGAYVVEMERHEDERGYFARSFCRDEFEACGLNPNVAQCNVSFNPKAGTLRGMHFQAPPHEEDKLVRCTRGAIYDVIVDLRPGSITRGKWIAVELTAANGLGLYVPKGFAHGFQTLMDETEVFYQMGSPYVAGTGRGVRWNDPRLDIRWPPAQRTISERDQNFPDVEL